MTAIERYATRIEDGIVSVEREDGWLQVGPIDAIVDEVGGETYVVEYDEKTAKLHPWIDGDTQSLEFDVRETVTEMDHLASFVQLLSDTPLKSPTGAPQRAEFFAGMLVQIWDAKGDLEDRLES